MPWDTSHKQNQSYLCHIVQGKLSHFKGVFSCILADVNGLYQLCHDDESLEDRIELKGVDEGTIRSVITLIGRHEVQERRVGHGKRDALRHCNEEKPQL